MEHIMGLLKIHVRRGIDLAVRDTMRMSSDPYVIVKLGKQKYRTRVVKKNLNPEWNEDLTLSIVDPSTPVKLLVYDRDTFSLDDKMGEAEFDIGPLLEALRMHLDGDLPGGTIIARVQPNRQNCLAEESQIIWTVDGKILQNMILRLRNVERGEVELQLEWINVPGSRGL
ncbi:hypothetical protein MLD38_001207 [Melastoma candidum]|uniref:Uncharacterized protein n=1 Tax=Melastoma candidum TaxID=119954 RepID=A0ACB9SCL4_9MYRT|nr:hypothetical protein MLD38_001207 [Melastoma candidum]